MLEKIGWNLLTRLEDLVRKQILKQGCLRRIGDRTRFYIDPCLSKDNSSYVESSNFLESKNFLVADLMEQGVRDWN
ncbi:hypothetical protein P3L10_028301 [Capsicum annuum]